MTLFGYSAAPCHKDTLLSTVGFGFRVAFWGAWASVAGSSTALGLRRVGIGRTRALIVCSSLKDFLLQPIITRQLLKNPGGTVLL